MQTEVLEVNVMMLAPKVNGDTHVVQTGEEEDKEEQTNGNSLAFFSFLNANTHRPPLKLSCTAARRDENRRAQTPHCPDPFFTSACGCNC
jgi:hypothetical protein